MIDIKSLTLGEVATVEDLGGAPLSAMADTSRSNTRLLIALAYVWKRRSIPEFSLIDAENLTYAEVEEILGVNEDDEDEDSEEGKGERS